MMVPGSPPYPQPRVDQINQPFIEAWRGGELELQHCTQCGAVVFYPRPHCPACWFDRMEWRRASGRGRIVSFSLVYRPNHEAFVDEVPIVLAEIELEEGANMLARVICETPDAVKSGAGVELLAPENASRYPLPVFRLSE